MTMTKLGGGVNELQVNLLKGLTFDWTCKDLQRVSTRFLVPTTQPLIMMKSLVTSP